jgi:hypothetical protein
MHAGFFVGKPEGKKHLEDIDVEGQMCKLSFKIFKM